MPVLLPRLPSPAIDPILESFRSADPGQWPEFDPRELPPATQFAPTGGARASARHLQELHDGIFATARDCGMGTGEGSGRRARARFDLEAATSLASNTLICDSEALRDEVWSFVGVVMAPQVVHWRFGLSRERYVGGVRNTFQRLWLRTRVLDRGSGHRDRWGLLAALTEDALVQITERPGISADPVLARALAEAWVRAARRFGTSKMEDIMRRATLLARVKNEIRSLSALDRESLAQLLDSVFDKAAAQTQGSQRPQPRA
ncbi:MAG: hypothetical protein OXN89_07200 [Bryobacterales bacterium]|nr:hypothetical protein [Bryobacterales bacterium]